MLLLRFKKVLNYIFTAMICVAYSNSSGQVNDEWFDLFNGVDLSKWRVKFTTQPLGVNYKNTFRVENNLLTVSYDNWDQFDGEFGHLFYEEKFSHYLLRIEYRFIGEQVNNGPGWAYRNNGIMLHSQDPETMTLNQEFPVSIESQLLGGNGKDDRTTLNVCTPGTNIVIDGNLITQHCTNSSSETFHGDQWVTAEIEVLGGDGLTHRVNGTSVLELKDIQLDEKDSDARLLLERGSALLLSQGYIAIQAESHPIQFRKIQIKPL